jgi:hypothetical protein
MNRPTAGRAPAAARATTPAGLLFGNDDDSPDKNGQPNETALMVASAAGNR